MRIEPEQPSDLNFHISPTTIGGCLLAVTGILGGMITIELTIPTAPLGGTFGLFLSISTSMLGIYMLDHRNRTHEPNPENIEVKPELRSASEFKAVSQLPKDFKLADSVLRGIMQNSFTESLTLNPLSKYKKLAAIRIGNIYQLYDAKMLYRYFVGRQVDGRTFKDPLTRLPCNIHEVIMVTPEQLKEFVEPVAAVKEQKAKKRQIGKLGLFAKTQSTFTTRIAQQETHASIYSPPGHMLSP